MKLASSDREIYQNIRNALKLGLPVAGLLAGGVVAQPQPPPAQDPLPQPEQPNVRNEKLNVCVTTGEVANPPKPNVRNEVNAKHRTAGKISQKPNARNEQPPAAYPKGSKIHVPPKTGNRRNERPGIVVTDGMVPRTVPQTAEQTVMDPVKTHRVQRGETLSGIAQRYGLSIDELCRLNGILPQNATRLREGRILVVSQPRPPAPATNRVNENKQKTVVPPGGKPPPGKRP